MYNQRALADRPALLLAHLRRRTLAYHDEASIQDPSSLRQFRLRHEPSPRSKILDGLPSCPFLGLLPSDLDALRQEEAQQETQRAEASLSVAARSRVGCMVHPLQNGGLDGRDCGVYDRFICQDYLCAAHDVMRREERWLVLAAIEQSYLYGLVLTDTRFVRELFEAAARENGAYPTARVLRRAAALKAARRYFELKLEWPYRHPENGLFGQVVPEERGLETRRRLGPSAQLGVEADATEQVLRCLGTRVASLEQLNEARAQVSARLIAFAQAVALDAEAP